MSNGGASTRTASGREIAYPVLRGRHAARIRTIEQWLIREAILEASAAEHDTVEHHFREMQRLYPKRGHLPMDDVTTLNEYLFEPTSRLPEFRSLWELSPLVAQ